MKILEPLKLNTFIRKIEPMKEEEILALGIDLGTTNSCVGIWRNNEVKIIQNSYGLYTTPSEIYFKEDRTIIGKETKENVPDHVENLIYDAKRIIGKKYNEEMIKKNWGFKTAKGNNGNFEFSFKELGKDVQKPPEYISSLILKQLKEDAEYYLEGHEIKNAVISVPANFDVTQRQATIDAAKIAGLNILSLINEPTAASLAYGLDKELKQDELVLIFDLGGGTFDVTLLKLERNNFRVIATNGIPDLGGQDFDNKMMEKIVEKYNLRNLDSKQKRILKEECEISKIQLSTFERKKNINEFIQILEMDSSQ